VPFQLLFEWTILRKLLGSAHSCRTDFGRQYRRRPSNYYPNCTLNYFPAARGCDLNLQQPKLPSHFLEGSQLAWANRVSRISTADLSCWKQNICPSGRLYRSLSRKVYDRRYMRLGKLTLISLGQGLLLALSQPSDLNRAYQKYYRPKRTKTQTRLTIDEFWHFFKLFFAPLTSCEQVASLHFWTSLSSSLYLLQKYSEATKATSFRSVTILAHQPVTHAEEDQVHARSRQLKCNSSISAAMTKLKVSFHHLRP
jgi:hypothetical protein